MIPSYVLFPCETSFSIDKGTQKHSSCMYNVKLHCTFKAMRRLLHCLEFQLVEMTMYTHKSCWNSTGAEGGKAVTRCASILLMATAGISFLCSNLYSDTKRQKDRDNKNHHHLVKKCYCRTWLTFLRTFSPRVVSSEVQCTGN